MYPRPGPAQFLFSPLLQRKHLLERVNRLLFNSFVFVFVFLPITWLLFRISCANKVPDVALALLLVASLVFYSYWNPPFFFLILFSILFNYSWGRLLEKSSKSVRVRKMWLYSGVAVNLMLIIYFKYYNFLMHNIFLIFGQEWLMRDIFVPLGISFFTFQQMAYLIDCSKGLAKEHSFTHYALFVTFFPQLIAGPIVRYEEIMPQFARLRTFVVSYRNIAMGLTLFSLGLFKKLIIADTFSPWVATAFDTDVSLTFFEAWAGVLSYTFQIYFDFSGYSDMALGLGKLFNIDLPINFDSPYKALSVADFWRRWHITLSSFLRDYLYIPLGGNRQGRLRRDCNLMGTMLLGGLWHGASWNFVIWGGLHGAFLVLNHAYRKILSTWKITTPRLLLPIYWFLTFGSVVFAWVFFRAVSFSRACDVLCGMCGGAGVQVPSHWMVVGGLRNFLTSLGVEIVDVSAWGIPGGAKQTFLLAICTLVVVFFPNSYEWASSHLQRARFSSWCSVGIGVLLAVSICFLNRISEFLYFQF